MRYYRQDDKIYALLEKAYNKYHFYRSLPSYYEKSNIFSNWKKRIMQFIVAKTNMKILNNDYKEYQSFVEEMDGNFVSGLFNADYEYLVNCLKKYYTNQISRSQIKLKKNKSKLRAEIIHKITNGKGSK